MISVSRFLAVIPLLSLLLAGGAFAFEDDSEGAGISGIQEKVSIGGYGFWQFGQIVNGHNYKLLNDVSHYWENNVLIGLSITAHTSEWLDIILNPEFYLNYPFPQQFSSPKSVRAFGFAYIKQAYGKFTFGDDENPFLRLNLGMFSFKYNHEVRNLGEYLFRTGTYPTYIINEFDYPAAQLLGLHASTEAIPNLHVDLLLTSEAFMFPLFDFSVALLARYNVLDAAEIGAGIDFARCLPVDDRRTTPTAGETASRNKYYKSNLNPADTAHYSFKATKLMVQASIDPKKFFGSPRIFGSEDLKIYGEICAVGLKGYDAVDCPIIDSTVGPDSTYRAWYDDLNARTPRMVGFNIPTFHGLDVLSFELEYFPSVLPNDFTNVITLQSPVPYLTVNNAEYRKENYDDGFFRWSLYAKKTVIDGFSVIAEAAFDHNRSTTQEGVPYEGENLTRKGNWHWKLKFLYAF
ncbi:MAG: hypothetical protein JW863_17845 [Chitinispirillaceae bacterium]|nr:hypothetical protein [Chitinispirillaceae bacterium]